MTSCVSVLIETRGRGVVGGGGIDVLTCCALRVIAV
jgi:hypothetical protein